MARSVAMITLCFSTLTLCSLASRIKQHAQTSSMGECGEPKMVGVCNCEKWSASHLFQGAWQCSSCVDTSKWGYGCKMDCPEECPKKCDFSGNCIPENTRPENCKRNGRVKDKTDESYAINNNGLCQACEDGYYGKMCESECPSGCKDSVEGMCMRDGSCYRCKEGFYGPRCADKCPDACPKCMMEAGVDDSGEEVPAGSCAESCRGDFFGGGCGEKCPDNCDRTGIKPGKASCARNDGTCKKCSVGYFGAQCKKQCDAGCIDGECEQYGGVCTKGCVAGRWGPTCSKTCPEFTIQEQGCDREDGLPESCDAKHYPSWSEEKGSFCEVCPAGCQDGECDDKGRCTKGCVTGKHGKTCSESCPSGCDEAGGCDQGSGHCKMCKPGFTGMKCSKSCHSQCATCKQFVTGLLGAVSPATGAGDCLTCPGDDASEMSDDSEQSCQCIGGSEREDANSACMCKQPKDPLWEARFETNPKKCATHCKEDYNGEPYRPVSGLGTTKCIPLTIYNAVASMWSKFYTGPSPEKGGDGCDPNEYKIEDEGKVECLHIEFVKHIAGEDAVAKKVFGS